MKKKIVFVFGALGGGGAQRQFGWLIEGIDKDFFEPIIVTIGTNENKAKEHLITYPRPTDLDEVGKKEEFGKYFLYRKLKNVNVKTFFVDRNGFFSVCKTLKKIIKEQKPELIFNTTPMAMSYSFLPSLLFSSAKVIHGVRGNGILLSYKRNIYNLFHLISQIGIDYFVCNSKGLEKNINRNGYYKKKIKVIYNGVPTFFNRSFDNEDFVPSNTIRVALIGRFDKVKDHDMFIKAINYLKTKREFSVHLYGAGELESELQKKIIELGLEQKIIIEGWITDVSEVLKITDVVCLTSIFEGFNNSISEAQMHGIPVVTTNCTGSNEIVVHEKTGFVVPINDDKEFSKKLQLLIDDDVIRMEFSKNAYMRSREEFSIPTMVKSYESFFEEIL